MSEVIKAKAIELPQEEMIEFDGFDVYERDGIWYRSTVEST